MDKQFGAEHQNKEIGKTWMLTNGTLLANVDTTVSKSIIKEVEFAHLYYLDVCKILETDGAAGAVIVERQHSTIVMGNFVSEHGNLVSADGEWIEGDQSFFDHCLARI